MEKEHQFLPPQVVPDLENKHTQVLVFNIYS